MPIENVPAFPLSGGDYIGEDRVTGMTLRDYFAAKVMQGIVGSISSEEGYTRLVDVAHMNGCDRVSEWIAKDSYKQADAMLAERAK